MTRILTAILASTAFLFVAAPSFASTAAAVAVASPSAMSGMKPMATPAASMKSTSKSTSTKKCPAGESYVKGYTKADGTKVKGYCRKSAS